MVRILAKCLPQLDCTTVHWVMRPRSLGFVSWSGASHSWISRGPEVQGLCLSQLDITTINWVTGPRSPGFVSWPDASHSWIVLLSLGHAAQNSRVCILARFLPQLYDSVGQI